MTEIFARNLTGDEFAVSAQSTLDNELNGNQILRLTIPPNQVNKRFIDDIDPLWEIDYYGNTYKVVYAKRTTKGHSFYIDVRCVHSALDKLDSIRTYERYDGSLTAISGFNRVFDGTGYDFVLGDTFYAIDIEGLGEGETRLEMFKRLLERYKAEFYIAGNTFYLEKYVGRDMNFEYRYRLNASNVQQENDGTAFFTYVRGFGDYDEGEENIVGNAGIKLTYEHPLAAVVGRRHAPMVAKGSYKTESAIRDAMKRSVDDSLVVSVSANVKDLRKQGYPFAQPEVGDRVFLVDDRIGYDEEVRVVKVVTERYANGNVKDIEVTFGNQKLGRRYAANLSSAMATLNSLMAGTVQLPFSVLDSRSQEMMRKIMSVDTELTLDNGIFAVDKNDPNKVVGLNSAGWFISDDGGATANVIATADGIVANYITSGQLQITENMYIVGEDSLMYWDANRFMAVNANDPDQFFEVTPQGAHASKGMFRVTRPDYYVDSSGKEYGVFIQDGIPNFSLAIQRNEFRHPDVSWTGQNYGTRSTYYLTYENMYVYHDAKEISASFGVSLRSDASVASAYVNVRLREFGNPNTNVSGTKRIIAYRDSGTTFDGITLNLGVPSYEPRQFYLEFCLDGDNAADNTCLVRTNRAVMRG